MPRALVVDDHAPTASALAELLIRDGWEVHVFTTPEAALDDIQRSSFDVVITDLEMPRVGGAEIARATRQYQPRACIVIMSGSLDDRKRLDQRGICILVTKPLDYARLIENLMSCGRRGAHGNCHLLGQG